MKVKNIMFSGFAAAILMGVVAEASAAPVAVASKGYVDSIAGQLDGLDGSAAGKANLVEAINTKLGRVAATGEALEDGEYYSSVTQAQNGQVAVQKANLATTIEDGVMKAPTTDAVHAAIQDVTYTGGTDININEDNEINATYDSLDYLSTNDETDHANQLIDGYAVSYVAQENGKVKIGAKEYVQRVNATSAEGQGGRHAPSTAAVWEAIQGVSGQTDDLDLAQVGADGSYIKLVSQADGLVSATAETFDTVVDSTTAESTKAPTTAAVYDALATKQNTLTTAQQAAVDSGITAEKVTTYDGYATSKQDKLTAGDFIDIAEDGTITTKYSAGNNIAIDADGKISTDFPDMPGVCRDTGVTCVLTSEGGAFKWAVLTNPVTDTTISGTEAQAQVIEEPATVDGTAVEVPGV